MRLLEVLEVFGMVWKVLEGFAGFGGSCEAMRSFERRGEAVGGFGRFCDALGASDRIWKLVRLSEALDALESFWEASGVFGSYGRLWEVLM